MPHVDPNVLSLALAGENVLFRQGDRQLFILNNSATVIFKALQVGQSEEYIVEKLVGLFGIDRSTAQVDLNRIVQQWYACDILVRDDSAPLVTPEPQPSAVYRSPSCSSYSINTYYDLAGESLKLQHNLMQLSSRLQPMLSHLLRPANETADHTLTVDSENCQYVLINDDVLISKSDSVDQLIVAIMRELIEIPARRNEEFCVLHACCVSYDGLSIALAGSGGSGKTTLTAALIQRGFGFVTDDVVPLRDGNSLGEPAAIRMSLCVKQGSFKTLQEYYPSLSSLVEYDWFGRTVKFLPPPLESLRLLNPVAVSVIIFPKFTPEKQGKSREISVIEALERLVLSDSKIGPLLDKDDFTKLIDWLHTTNCFSINYGSTEEGIARVKIICSELGRHQNLI